jgi:hypothetical protein
MNLEELNVGVIIDIYGIIKSYNKATHNLIVVDNYQL